jgi:HD-GYP domain-containing protein (c-di-GMP phosphodiesterase class II)
VISPDVVRAFLSVAENEAFWISLAPRHVQLYLADLRLDAWRVNIDFPRFHDVALLISSIVDAKSPFTASHSLGVARLSRRVAERIGLPEDTCANIEVAGLMHDVGKLCVPDEIVDKPARLTPREFVLMERHSFETYQIVRHVPGLEQIAEWAAFHHEKLDGCGYPFHRSGQELSIEPRIVAVADIFQALSQARPYRQARPIEQVRTMLRQFVDKGHLDPALVAAVEEDIEGCWTAAVEPSAPSSLASEAAVADPIVRA